MLDVGDTMVGIDRGACLPGLMVEEDPRQEYNAVRRQRCGPEGTSSQRQLFISERH